MDALDDLVGATGVVGGGGVAEVFGEGDAEAGEVLDLLEGDVAVLADGELVLDVHLAHQLTG